MVSRDVENRKNKTLSTEKTISNAPRALHCCRDTCPTCKNAKLDYDPGHGQTRDEPAEPPQAFCGECGDSFDVDFERQAKRELAMNIASDLFTSGQGHHVPRLVLTMDNGRDVGGWCQSAVEDRIFAALSR